MTARNLTIKRRWSEVVLPSGMVITIPPDDNLKQVTVNDDIDPYAESATQEYPLGTKIEYGREVYRYTLCGGSNVEIGALCQSVVPLAGHINELCGTTAVGDTTINFCPAVATTDDLVENELAQGYIYMYDAIGEGAKYRIKSHPAIVGATGGLLTLYDPIRILTTTGTTKATVMHNKFYKFIIIPGGTHVGITATPCGWTVAAVTANYYCWLQTKGPLTALIDGTVVMGKEVRPSEDDDGAVAAMDYNEGTMADLGAVGWVMEIGSDAAGGAATYGLIDARLE